MNCTHDPGFRSNPLLALGIGASLVLGACGGSHVDRRSQPVLRSNLGVDIEQVVSFAFVASAPSGPSTGTLLPKASDGGVDPGANGGLFALTLQGETLSVELLEEGNPDVTRPVEQPYVEDIYSTASWVLFRTRGLELRRPAADGGDETVDCTTIAARRADGALFCSAFSGRPSTHGLDSSLQGNAAGDVVYLAGGDPASTSERVYRLALDGPEGPTAVGVTPLAAMPWWFYANADGDLLHSYSPSPLDPGTIVLSVFPIDGGAPVSFGSRPAGQATRGAFGAPDENTFYVMVGGGNSIGFEGSIRVLTKQGGSFVETEVTPTLTNLLSYGIMLRIADDIFLFSQSEKSLARIFDAGTFVSNPTPVAITGVDSFLDVSGLAVTPAGGSATFLANTPTGLQFVRHDGTTQQNIPVPSDLTLTRVTYALDGSIDFIAVRTSTLESVRGSVEVGATAVTVATTGVLDPARIVTFTRIR